MSERLRLFVALELPADVREAIAVPEVEGLRAVAPDALHVTLAFLGSRPPGDVEAISEVLRAQAGSPAPRLVPGDPILLPPRRPRVVAVALDDLDGTLLPLQERVAAGLAQAGVYSPEKRPFRPHVTVARVRPGAPPPRLGAAAERPPFTAERLTLFRSQLHPKGARYAPVTGVMLAG
jgi:RNA 2',3'-cyclic 3'-phosphodiesterase